MPDYRSLCSLQVARRTYHLDSYRLPVAAMAAGFEDFSHHDALADAEACAAIIVHAAARHEADDIEQLAHITRVRFGAIGPVALRDDRAVARPDGPAVAPPRPAGQPTEPADPGDVGGPCDTRRMEILLLVIGLVAGIALGALGTWFLAQRRAATADGGPATEDPALVEARHQAELAAAHAAHAAEQARVLAEEQQVQAQLRAELAAFEATADGLREQIEAARAQYREIVERQRVEQRDREAREAADSKVLQALAPVKQTLTDMQAKVTALETQRHQQHGELSQQLKIAAENEERLRSTAESLASALRSNSTRGVWGETQLRSVVEAAGLIERVDFDTQRSITTDSGAGRPDMVIHLPGGKNIAVDAKVPFNAYLEASQIPATAIGRRWRTARAPHEAARQGRPRPHRRARQQELLGGPRRLARDGHRVHSERVVGLERARGRPRTLEFAFSKRVALASPVTLWSVLKTVAFSWQQDVLTKEAKTLFDLSRELYARLATTAGQIEKLGRTIERSVKDYNAFVGSLESRVLPTARKLKALDETKVLATLEGIEESPRELTAYEFTTAAPADINARRSRPRPPSRRSSSTKTSSPTSTPRSAPRSEHRRPRASRADDAQHVAGRVAEPGDIGSLTTLAAASDAPLVGAVVVGCRIDLRHHARPVQLVDRAIDVLDDEVEDRERRGHVVGLRSR